MGEIVGIEGINLAGTSKAGHGGSSGGASGSGRSGGGRSSGRSSGSRSGTPGYGHSLSHKNSNSHSRSTIGSGSHGYPGQSSPFSGGQSNYDSYVSGYPGSGYLPQYPAPSFINNPGIANNLQLQQNLQEDWNSKVAKDMQTLQQDEQSGKDVWGKCEPGKSCEEGSLDKLYFDYQGATKDEQFDPGIRQAARSKLKGYGLSVDHYKG